MGDRLHAFTDDVLGTDDATGLAHRIAAGEISRIEVVEAAVARAEKVAALDAIAFTDFEHARLRVQRELDRQPVSARDGVFAGVPTFIKDNTDVEGIPTGQGSAAFHAPAAKSDSPITTALFGLGLVGLGKSRLPEFGLNASTEFVAAPPARNPWNTGYSTGASSGGSAALVAAGVVPIAHANDGGGSIRIPAACCGLVGLKGTRGRFAGGPVERILPINIISEGVLTRSVRDTATVAAELEAGGRNQKLQPIGRVEGPGRRRLRVGLVRETVTSAVVDPETTAALEATATLLAGLGHHVEETTVPVSPQFEDDFSLYWGLLASSLKKFGPKLMHATFDNDRFDPLTLGLAEYYRQNLRATVPAVRRLRAIEGVYAEFFGDFDVVLSPVLTRPVPELGYLSPTIGFTDLFDRLRNYVAFTPLNNISGGPAISLPTGVSATGLPIGTHFSAAHGDERTLLELAFEIEAAQPWRRITD